MSAKHRILIVDDEPLNVKLLAALLSAEKYETIQAYSGEEALGKIAAESPDLVLLDIMMPNMDGYEVTRRLKNNPKSRDIPVILVTALDGTDNKIKGLEAGADEFLNKPVSTPELLARVKSLLRLKKYQDQLKMRSQSTNFFTPPMDEKKTIQNTIDLPTILLVEDDKKDAKLIQSYLHGEPYQIKLVKDGEETMACVQQEKIDLIVLDILLPGIDGFEVCRRLKNKEQTRNIQIVAITSLRDLESKIRGIELGADDYLVKPINRHELGVRVKALIKKKAYLDSLHEGYESAVHSAITDKLTGLYNQAYFKHVLDFEIKRSLRQKSPVSLFMLDVDDFKQYNDNLGHLAGDEILMELGGLIRASVRDIDLAARYGGEEFAVVFSNTDIDEAVMCAERIRQIIHSHTFSYTKSLPSKNLSVSVGVAIYPSDAGSVEELIEKADSALYKAKREGKNRVCLYNKNSGKQN
jgi:two-component system cell cycle response regulator